MRKIPDYSNSTKAKILDDLTYAIDLYEASVKAIVPMIYNPNDTNTYIKITVPYEVEQELKKTYDLKSAKKAIYDDIMKE